MQEDKCLKCGRCCYMGFYDRRGFKTKTTIKCPYLTEDNLCNVYNNRPKWCITAEEMKKKSLLLDGCGYK